MFSRLASAIDQSGRAWGGALGCADSVSPAEPTRSRDRRLLDRSLKNEKTHRTAPPKGDLLSWFWWLLGIVVLVIWIASVADIVRRRHTLPRSSLYAWVLLVIILPVIGSIGYFAVNGTKGGLIERPDLDASRPMM
jgi:hypothetical protein